LPFDLSRAENVGLTVCFYVDEFVFDTVVEEVIHFEVAETKVFEDVYFSEVHAW